MEIPETKVLSIFHRGSYASIGEAYVYIMNYAEKNGYRPTGKPEAGKMPQQ